MTIANAAPAATSAAPKSPAAHAAAFRKLRGVRGALGGVLLLGLLTACADGGNSAGTDDEEPVILIGERAGLMVWRAFSGATSYRVEVFAPNDTVEHSVVTADTVGGYPAGFQSGTGKTWQVRAFSGDRQIARSIKAPVY